MPVFTYYDADTDGQVYHVLPDADWDDVTSAAESESDTISSGTTIQSGDLPGKYRLIKTRTIYELATDTPSEGYFIMHHGRPQPAAGKVAKFYPSDNVRRCILQYLVRNSVFGGDYLGPVQDILTPTEGRQKQGLEIGTKTGTWIQSMATEFPHVQFRSVDIVPVMAHIPRPNVTFEVYDFTDGLMLEDGSQDAVFINAVVELVKDYQSLLREAHRVLRPGGLLHIVEHYLRVWGPENMSELASRIAPHTCHLVETVREQIFIMGLDPDTPIKLADWLAPGSNLWKAVEGQNVGFEQIESVVRTFPVYPHDGFPCASPVETRMVPFIRNMVTNTVQEFFSVLKDRGIEEGAIKEMIKAALEELEQHDSCIRTKLYCVYAVKR